jgi:adenine/guanine/hypoxanthine permease
MNTTIAPRRRFGGGDLNGVLGLVVDNLSLLAFMATALIGIFGMPADIVFRRMFPGTALGVLLGNLAYTWMARRLAARTGREDVTAMPLGIDAPTTIGMALLVLGPAFAGYRQAGMDPVAAGRPPGTWVWPRWWSWVC